MLIPFKGFRALTCSTMRLAGGHDVIQAEGLEQGDPLMPLSVCKAGHSQLQPGEELFAPRETHMWYPRQTAQYQLGPAGQLAQNACERGLPFGQNASSGWRWAAGSATRPSDSSMDWRRPKLRFHRPSRPPGGRPTAAQLHS